MSAPTKQEIREAIEAQWSGGRLSGTTGDGLASELRNLIRDVAAPLSNPAWLSLEADASDWDRSEPDPHDVWNDLRISEARRLRELCEAAVEQAALDCEAAIVSALTSAGVQFAAEYPDAPRAKVEEAA